MSEEKTTGAKRENGSESNLPNMGCGDSGRGQRPEFVSKSFKAIEYRQVLDFIYDLDMMPRH